MLSFLFSSYPLWIVGLAVVGETWMSVFSNILGQRLTSYLYWIMVLGLIGLKVYIKWTTAECKSRKRMYGKTAIVTGANSGIGKQTALALAYRGAKVILACRNLKEAREVRDEIITRTENKKVEVHHLDLCSLDSIRSFAKNIINTEQRLDVLINNAGAGGLGNKRTSDNLQIGMQVNHFGPFLLTCLLAGKMKQSTPSRIVIVSSLLHHCAKFDIDNLNCEKSFNESQVYFCSKLANIMIGNELAKKLEGTGVTVNSVHPGLVNTRIWKHLPNLLQPIFKYMLLYFFKDAREAAQTSIYLACDKDLDEVTGRFFCDCEEVIPSQKVFVEGLGKKLWEKSEAFVGLKPEEKDF